MIAVPLSIHAITGRCQTDFLAVLPAVKRHANACFRRLPACHKAEWVAETIAWAFVAYVQLAHRDKLSQAYPGTLASYAAKAVRNQRHVGGHMAGRDVCNPLVQRRHRFAVGRLPACAPGNDDWSDLVLASRRVSPADQACFNVDFQQWFNQWPLRQRRIINALAAGHGTKAVARQFDISAPRVSQLRRQYRLNWQQFQGQVDQGQADQVRFDRGRMAA